MGYFIIIWEQTPCFLNIRTAFYNEGQISTKIKSLSYIQIDRKIELKLPINSVYLMNMHHFSTAYI